MSPAIHRRKVSKYYADNLNCFTDILSEIIISSSLTDWPVVRLLRASVCVCPAPDTTWKLVTLHGMALTKESLSQIAVVRLKKQRLQTILKT